MNSQDNVLIVDDDENVLRSLAAQLQEAGYTCATAGDGRAALDALRKGQYTVAIIDLEMPAMDGFELLTALAQQGRGLVPIVLTGVGDVAKAVRAIKLGAFDFLEKPCNPELLVSAIGRAGEYRSALQHAREMQSVARQWQATFDASPDLLIVTGLDGHIVRCNRAATTLAPAGRATLAGWRCHEALCGAAHDSADCPFEAAPRERGGVSSESTLMGRLFEVSCAPLLDENREGWGWLYWGRDITERKAAEAEAERAFAQVQEKERETQSLLKGAKAVFESQSFADAARKIFDACCEATGAVSGYIALLSADGAENEALFLEAGGMPCDVSPELPMPIRGLRAEAYRTGEVAVDNDFMNSPWVEYMPAGHAVLRNVMFAPLKIDGLTVGIMGLANKPTDFTGRDVRLAATFGDMAAIALESTRTHDAVRASEEKFRQIVDNIGVGVALISPEMRILQLNTQMRKWFPEIDLEEGPICHQAFNDPPGQEPCAWCPTVKTLRDGQVHVATTSTPRRAGTRNYRIVSSPIHDGEGRIAGAIEMVEDTTEEQRTEQELRQSQKLEAVGRLAAGIAHEINTPTQYVGDNIEFLQIACENLLELTRALPALIQAGKQGAVPEPLLAETQALLDNSNLDYFTAQVPRAIDQSMEGVGRIAAIVHAMKDFSHPGSSEKTYADINACIKSTITVSRGEWKYTADVQLDLEDDLPPVMCLPGELNQVILNMIVNAAHAIGDKAGGGSEVSGTITIATRLDGDWLEITIADNGAGIPESIRSRIFDPFFTTKEVGRGTGQGLAIARSVIVDKHGGTISVESEIGKGTSFTIRLPIGS